MRGGGGYSYESEAMLHLVSSLPMLQERELELEMALHETEANDRGRFRLHNDCAL